MLQDLAARLTIPGLPDWVGLVLLVLLGLVILAYLLMPFSVFGLKGRLDSIEAQLDEIQAEIRGLALRLPEPSRRQPVESDWAEPPAGLSQPARNTYTPPRATPPVPPPAVWPEMPARGSRPEPRLDWPRDR